MKKLSKKLVIFIGIIVLALGGLSLYLINTPREMTRTEELKAEKEKTESKPVLTTNIENEKINIEDKEDLFLEKTLIPLINNIINYEYISYDTESGIIHYYISADMVSKYGTNGDMWAELADKLNGVLKKNEEENSDGNKYNLLVKELNKDEKVFLYLRQNGETSGVYAPGYYVPKTEEKESEELNEKVYLEKRVTFNQELNSALLLIGQNLENSTEYTDDLSQNITDLGLVIGDYLLENTPTEKYTESEKILRSTLNIYSNVRLNLFYAMRDKDTETILELQKKMDGANQMMEVSNYLLNDEAIEEIE
ncbi:hypothetical protein [Carnobacterium pleistocenium]|uniref:hypothetical protein n=1 Tax=Carnobacterium pleistocenium TaxID=181073 RepID=UPI00055536AF|nr:hypothetical protein [Carnobacterium pleistocenium]